MAEEPYAEEPYGEEPYAEEPWCTARCSAGEQPQLHRQGAVQGNNPNCTRNMDLAPATILPRGFSALWAYVITFGIGRSMGSAHYGRTLLHSALAAAWAQRTMGVRY